jgi:hypothetical protein
MPIPTAGAMITARTNRGIIQFIRAEAFSETNARTPEELCIRNGFIFTRLVNQGVLIEVSNYRYFLNRENLVLYRSKQRKRALIMLLMIFILIVATSVLSR